jgi:hypothetical protein
MFFRSFQGFFTRLSRTTILLAIHAAEKSAKVSGYRDYADRQNFDRQPVCRQAALRVPVRPQVQPPDQPDEQAGDDAQREVRS